MTPSGPIRRRDDGSIDTEHYGQLARALRRARARELLRRTSGGEHDLTDAGEGGVAAGRVEHGPVGRDPLDVADADEARHPVHAWRVEVPRRARPGPALSAAGTPKS